MDEIDGRPHAGQSDMDQADMDQADMDQADAGQDAAHAVPCGCARALRAGPEAALSCACARGTQDRQFSSEHVPAAEVTGAPTARRDRNAAEHAG